MDIAYMVCKQYEEYNLLKPYYEWFTCELKNGNRIKANKIFKVFNKIKNKCFLNNTEIMQRWLSEGFIAV